LMTDLLGFEQVNEDAGRIGWINGWSRQAN
jgi:hypothetical protein